MLVIYKKTGTNNGSPEMIAECMNTDATVYQNKSGQPFPNERGNLVLRYGCRGNIPEDVKSSVSKILNTASSIKITTDKSRFRKHLIDLGKGWLIPTTYFSYATFTNSVNFLADDTWYMIRGRTHQRGSHCYATDAPLTIKSITEFLGEDTYYIQKYIHKAKEYRVNFVQGRAVQVLEKIPSNREDIVWNEANTVNVRWRSWPKLVVRAALLAAKSVEGLFMGSVDVIVDADDLPYVLEINTSPELTPYQAECFAKALDWCVENDRYNTLGFNEDHNGWEEYIHPCHN